MTDLSEVIGKAIGGEMGSAIDDLIDTLRMYHSERQGRKLTDTDVVVTALVDFAHRGKTEVAQYHGMDEEVREIDALAYSYKENMENRGVLTE